ncbi:unnamed protein product, partial [marine sediment metagenome]
PDSSYTATTIQSKQIKAPGKIIDMKLSQNYTMMQSMYHPG